MPETHFIMLLVTTCVGCLGIGVVSALVLRGWVLIVVAAGLVVIGYRLSEYFGRGGGWSSLGATIFFYAFVPLGVGSFLLGAFVVKTVKGREQA